MTEYPTIDWRVSYLSSCFVFDKYDGSLVRAEWTRKRGFSKFGRRNGLLDHSTPVLLEAPDLILEKYGDDLARAFRKLRWNKATAFLEFCGPGSFCGVHLDEPHTVTLFDIAADKKGILEPKVFVKQFGHLDHATLLHRGAFNRSLEEQVRSGTLPGMTFEGVVVKGGYKRPGQPWMFKVKNGAWLERLRARCGEDTAMFEKLK